MCTPSTFVISAPIGLTDHEVAVCTPSTFVISAPIGLTDHEVAVRTPSTFVISAPIGLTDHEVAVCTPSTFVISAPIGLTDHEVAVRTPSTSAKCTEPVVTKTSSRSHKPSDRARFSAAFSLGSRETLFHLPTCGQLNFFNSSIRTLLDLHLPEPEIRRCSSDMPYLIRRRQNTPLSGNRLQKQI